jgi:peptidoglycan/LPS O-acetylase OafA/YrhL
VFAAHLFYAEYLLHCPVYNPVFWTLCYEVQYYLALTLLTALAQRLPLWNYPLAGVKNGSRFILFLPLVMLSFYFFARSDVRLVLGIACWFAFFVGVVVWNVIEGSVAAYWLWWYLAAIIVLAVPRYLFIHDFPFDLLWVTIVAGTAGSIFAAYKLGGLQNWLSGKVFQFLGRISYSLYLIHFPILGLLNPLGDRICRASAWLSIPWSIVTIGICIGAAWVLYRCVEGPSHRLAASLGHYERMRRGVTARSN